MDEKTPTFARNTRIYGGRRALAVNLCLLFLGTPLAMGANNQAPCPYKIETKFEEPLRTLSKFTLKFTPEPSASLTEMKVDFGVHNLYEIKDSEGNKIDQSTLKPNDLTRFAIELGPDNPGLISLTVSTASSTDCADSHLIDAGFRDIVIVKSPTQGIELLETPTTTVDSGRIPFSINFVRASTDKTLYFSLPLTALVEVSGENVAGDPTITADGVKAEASSNVRVTFPPGTSPGFTINDGHWGTTRTIKVSVFKGDEARALGTYFLHYRTNYPQWILFLMTVLGALLYVGIESIPALNKTSGGNNQSWWALLTMDRYSKLILALGVSSVVFLFKDAGFLKAIKLDSASLMAYLTYGFCAGALGLEAVLKKVKELL
ncbi:MAG TPA: hypothetical protein VFA68_20025 [Terriglobales bacterium]|nr:hypothetical protein [Terriglobales bacterium]